MTSILGISAFYHDSAACLLKDGKIIAAAQEERFSRKKHDPRYPYHAIEFVLNHSRMKLSEIDQIVNIFKKKNNKNFALLKCTSTYPSDPKETNLLAIKKLKNRYKCEVGLSDHTIGIGASVASISLGASILTNV